jgi:predicted RND superfamily exporter protein
MNAIDFLTTKFKIICIGHYIIIIYIIIFYIIYCIVNNLNIKVNTEINKYFIKRLLCKLKD